MLCHRRPGHLTKRGTLRIPAARRRILPTGVEYLAGLLLFLWAWVGAQERNFHHYTTSDGVPQRQVLSVVQTHDGFIWMGTFGGVSRYDGRQFRVFTARDGLQSNTILDLAVDRDGRLVAGTGQGLCYFRAHQMRFDCPYDNGPLSDGHVNRLMVDDDALWVATNRGLVHIAAGEVRAYSLADGLPHEEVLSMLRADEDQLWVGTQAGLVLLDGDRMAGDVVLGNRQITALLDDGDGLLVATDQGLFDYRDGNTRRAPGLPEAFGNAPFTTAVRLSDGTEWFGTRTGALRRSNGEFEVFGENEGLASAVVHTIYEDREKNLWFGTQVGASKKLPGAVVAMDERHGLPHPFVRALAVGDDGRLLVGTRNGLAVHDMQTGEWQSLFRTDNGAGESRIYSLAAGDGTVWIGTADGLYAWNGNGRERHFQGPDELPAQYIPSLLIDRSDRLWIGTAKGVRIVRDGRPEPPRQELLAQEFIMRMHEDARGRLWFGLRDAGLAMLDTDGSLRVFDQTVGLSSQTIWDLGEDSAGRVWVASNGEGAFRIDPEGRIEQYRRDTIHDDFIWNLLVDDRDRTWLFGNRGLLRLDPDSGEQRLFTDRDGLPDLEGSATAAAVAGGRLWFGTGEGLVRYSPDDEFFNQVPPDVYVTATRQDGEEVVSPEPVLPYAESRLRFHFSAITFRDEQRARFRYRLVGHDEDWSAPDTSDTVRYGGLGPGRYEFQVLAANGDGVWSTSPARFAFEVARPWWGHPLAWTAGLFLLALTGWGGIRLSVWRIDHQRRQLKQEVAQRTRELEQKNRELERLAITDELTGLYNRRHFMSRLQHEWELLMRSPTPTPLSIIIVDLDHFKSVNDRYGHVVGDLVLAEAGRRLHEAARRADTLARYGGEEFAMVLPFTEDEGAVQAAERMLQSLTRSPVEVVRGVSIEISASIGTATAVISRANAGIGLDELIRRADAALYDAKHSGRSQVAAAPGESS